MLAVDLEGHRRQPQIATIESVPPAAWRTRFHKRLIEHVKGSQQHRVAFVTTLVCFLPVAIDAYELAVARWKSEGRAGRDKPAYRTDGSRVTPILVERGFRACALRDPGYCRMRVKEREARLYVGCIDCGTRAHCGTRSRRARRLAGRAGALGQPCLDFIGAPPHSAG